MPSYRISGFLEKLNMNAVLVPTRKKLIYVRTAVR
jgi:hypothetical protein